MDFAQALNQLWTRRGWALIGVAVALVVALSTAYDISPSGLHKKTLALGTGSTVLLVDTPRSSVTDLRADLKPLAERAYLFARLATSEVVTNRIAQNVGISPNQLDVQSPLDGALRPQSPRETRVTSILAENRAFRLNFIAQTGLPNIQINAQAPRVADAIRLANTAAGTFAGYVHKVQRTQNQPESSQVVLRQLGPARGGLIAKDINLQLALFAFVATLIGFCVLILVISGVVQNLRTIREAERTPARPLADESA
jgi:hypothetical protein